MAKDTRHTTHDTRYTIHDTRYTIHDTRHTTHDTRHTTHDTRHTTHTTHDTRYQMDLDEGDGAALEALSKGFWTMDETDNHSTCRDAVVILT